MSWVGFFQFHLVNVANATGSAGHRNVGNSRTSGRKSDKVNGAFIHQIHTRAKRSHIAVQATFTTDKGGLGVSWGRVRSKCFTHFTHEKFSIAIIGV